MKISINISSNVNNKDWDKELCKNKESSTYQTSNFGQVYNDAYNSEPVYVWAHDEKGRTVGQLLTLFHKEYFWRNANFISQKIFPKFNFNSCMWSYGPIIHDKENEVDIIKKMFYELENYAKKKNTMLIHGSSPPLYNYNQEYFRDNHYSNMPWKTYIVSLLTDKEKIFQNLNKKTRYDVRKSMENNLEFEVRNDFDSLNFYTKLSVNAPARKKENRKFEEKFVDSFYQNLLKEGLAKVIIGKSENEPIGGILLLTFNQLAIQMGVENSSKTDLLGGPFLTWNTIIWLLENGFKYFDLGGANPIPNNSKEKQIDFYKAKWGGDELPFSRFMKITKSNKYKIFRSLSNTSQVFKNITKRKT